jgi:hypothetical protein
MRDLATNKTSKEQLKQVINYSIYHWLWSLWAGSCILKLIKWEHYSKVLLILSKLLGKFNYFDHINHMILLVNHYKQCLLYSSLVTCSTTFV